MTPNRPKHLLATLAIALVVGSIIAILTKGLSLNPDSRGQAMIGQPAKDFQASWLQGQELLGQTADKKFSLKDFHGKGVILNFWASWCGSCQAEAQVMEAFWQAHKGEGLFLVGIAIQDSPEAARAFAQKLGKSYPLGLDVDGSASIEYGITGVPETFFIDPQGVLRHKITGPVDYATLEAYLPLLLKKGDAP